MLRAEAIWLKDAIYGLPLQAGTNVLNFGSKQADYLERRRFIAENIDEPSRARGFRMVNLDLVDGPGVDLAGGICDPTFFEIVRRSPFGAVYLFNVLERVNNIQELSERIECLVDNGGWILVSVPHAYPPHDDPIDNGFRPEPHELARLFPTCRCVKELLHKSSI